MDANWTIKDRHNYVLRDKSPRTCRASLKSVTVSRDDRIVKGVVSADCLDTEKEVIQPKGLRFGPDQYFMGTTKAVYLDHAWAQKGLAPIDKLPIGTCRHLAHRGDELYSHTYITKRAIGDELLILIDEEALRCLTVGAIGDDEGAPTHAELKRYGPECTYVMRTGDMLEYSLTAMPANPKAVLKCLTRGDIRRTTASLFLPDEVSPDRKVFPVNGPAKCSRTLVIGADMDVEAILG